MKVERILLALLIVVITVLVVSFVQGLGCACCAGGYSEACCHYDTPNCMNLEAFFKIHSPENYEECFDYALKEYWDKDCMIEGRVHVGCCSYGWSYSERICRKVFE